MNEKRVDKIQRKQQDGAKMRQTRFSFFFLFFSIGLLGFFSAF